MQRVFKFLARWLLRLVLIAVFVTAGLNLWMVMRSRDRVYHQTDGVPAADTALVLGTGKRTEGGSVNAHFRVRMDGAAALYQAGLVKQLLLSGDKNSAEHYNEPEDMRQALLARGVPAAAMTCDYDGFRTLDSIVRAHDVFGLRRCIIVTDDFHLPRALWLADRNGIESTGFIAEQLPWSTSWLSRTREWAARVLAVADEWILGTRPKSDGKRVSLPARTMESHEP